VARSHAELASTPETVRWGRLPGRGAAPVVELADGGVLVVDTVSHEGILPDQGGDPVAFFGSLGIPSEEVLADAIRIAKDVVRDGVGAGPHVVTGPVAIAGARAGDLVRVETLRLERRARYGVVSNRHGRGVLSGVFPGALTPTAAASSSSHDDLPPAVVSHLALVAGDGSSATIADGAGRTIRFPLREFLGLVGVTPATDEELDSTPPGPYGGNLDVRRLGVGTSLLLPVAVDGALVYAGDPHYAQGNGEVALTAFEAPLRSTLRLSLERGAEARRIAQRIAHPVGETADELIVIGIGTTLDEAMRAATSHAVVVVHERTGLEPATALAYLSAAADFEVSQAVNGVRGVHCVIDKRHLESVTEPATPGAGGTVRAVQASHYVGLQPAGPPAPGGDRR
jgi:acetamidase/formamidase